MPLGTPRILVVGDLILDQWIEGTAERLSPEAACPVFRPSGKWRQSWGGAAAVAEMVAALGAKVTLMGRMGFQETDDIAFLHGLPQLAKGVTWAGMFQHEWHQTVKTRFVTPTGQVLRFDNDDCRPFGNKRFIADVVYEAQDADVVLLSDYGKGVLTKELCEAVIFGHDRVIVDPARGADWWKYSEAWGIKPNERELADMQPIGVEWTLTTLGDRGMRLQRLAPHSAVEIPARRSAARDPIGCGDQVLATLGVCLGSGMELVEACRWANAAAGLQVERIGIVPVRRDELIREMGGGKIVSAAEAAQIAARAREEGKRVVFTNGCFDLFSAGHASCLREAKAQGDMLFVGLNSDESARTIKGPLRPYRPQGQRAAVLEAVEAVDWVVLFDQPTEVPLLELIRPHVLVKGGDYAGHEAEIPGREFIESISGRLHITERLFDVSTTITARRICEQVA